MRLMALDLETDPFTPGQHVQPFTWGLWDGIDFHNEWHEDPRRCIGSLVRFIDTLPFPHHIVAHNGGHFDFIWLLPFIDPNPVIINGRIVKAKLHGHTLHDSFAILPVSLGSQGNKTKIDYDKMRKPVRRRHAAEIIAYLRQDCVELFDAVAPFIARFGNKLTMASAAIGKLKEASDGQGGELGEHLGKLSLRQDAQFRRFYFGGRVEAFEKGVIRDEFVYYDVNSMYPDVMKNELHPVGNQFAVSYRIDGDTDFAIIDAYSRGALPLRGDKGGLSFPTGRAVFNATGHEIRAAMAAGLLDIFEVQQALTCSRRMNFASFVQEYWDLRKEAERQGDARSKLHFKLVLNSSYGRFSLDPEKLFEWRIVVNQLPEDSLNSERYDAELSCYIRDGFDIYQRGPEVTMLRRLVTDAQQQRALMNVATGASITGAARAKLLRGLVRADRAVYCDTDSVIARGLDADLGGGLGQWKIETSADRAAIAGKKMYALFQGMNCVKLASKGAKLQPSQIIQVAQGQTVRWKNSAPTFSVAGRAVFIERNIRMT